MDAAPLGHGTQKTAAISTASRFIRIPRLQAKIKRNPNLLQIVAIKLKIVPKRYKKAQAPRYTKGERRGLNPPRLTEKHKRVRMVHHWVEKLEVIGGTSRIRLKV